MDNPQTDPTPGSEPGLTLPSRSAAGPGDAAAGFRGRGWRKIDQRFFLCQLDLVESAFERLDPHLVQGSGEARKKAYLELAAFFAWRRSHGPEEIKAPPTLTQLYFAKSRILLFLADAELKQVISLCQSELGKIQDQQDLRADQVVPDASGPPSGMGAPFQPAPWQSPTQFYRAQYLVDRLYSLIRNIKEREYARAESAYTVLLAQLIIFGLCSWCFLVWSLASKAVHPLTWSIMAFGGLGASASILQRIQKSVQDDYSVAYLVRLRHGRLSLCLSVLLGGVFAVILTLVLCSGIAELVFSDKIASALPKSGEHTGNIIRYYLIDFGESSLALQSVSRTLVLSFLAGFSERLVPDVLSRIEIEAMAGKQTGKVPVAGT